MATSEERLTTLEKTVASLRNDFLQAIIENTRSMSTLNKVILQQEQNARDANHEITILTGVIASQGQDIKAITSRMDGFDLQFASQGRDISSQGQDIREVKNRMDGFDRHFASLDGKLEQVLQILTTPPGTD